MRGGAALDKHETKSILFGITALGNSVSVHVSLGKDSGLKTAGKVWLRIHKGDWSLTSITKTNCQIEVDLQDESRAIQLPCKGDYSLIAPIRTLSLDIECFN